MGLESYGLLIRRKFEMYDESALLTAGNSECLLLASEDGTGLL